MLTYQTKAECGQKRAGLRSSSNRGIVQKYDTGFETYKSRDHVSRRLKYAGDEGPLAAVTDSALGKPPGSIGILYEVIARNGEEARTAMFNGRAPQ